MESNLTILEALAKSKEPLNQYRLRQKTRLAKKTVERAIPKLKTGGWIGVKRVEHRRGPNPSEFYELTDLGRYRVAASSNLCYLARCQEERLGTKLQDFVDKKRIAREVEAERWSQLLREVLLSRKATPGWRLRIDLKADKMGKIHSDISVSRSLSKKREQEIGERAVC